MTSSTREMIRRLGCIAIAVVLLGLSGAASAQTSVLCIGDSITYGVGCTDRTTTSYPTMLGGLLNSSGTGTYTVSCDAVSGFTTDAMLGRLQTTSSSLLTDPDIVTVLLGTGDINVAGEADLPTVVDVTAGDLQNLVNYIANYDYADGVAPTIFVSAVIPMCNDVVKCDYVRQLNVALESSLTGATFFTSNWDDMYEPSRGLAYWDMMADNLHANDAGHAVMVENFYEAIVTPEPASITLLACGALAMVRRRRK